MQGASDRRSMTERELDYLPDDGRRHELRGGVLISAPAPNYLHARVQAAVVSLLRVHVRAHGIGDVLGECGCLLATNPDTVLTPDVAFVGRERAAALRDERRFFPGAPDLAVEILSPSNRPGEVHGKVADYLAAGARLVWVIDPEARSVTTYRSILAPRHLAESAVLDGEDVLPGFSLSVGELFER